MSQVQQQIQDLVQAIFNNRQSAELTAATREFTAMQADHSRRGVLNSGMTILATTRAYEAAVIRTVERTLEELASEFRKTGRRDPNLFWNLVEPKIRELGLSFHRSAMATAASKLRNANVGAIARTSEQSYAQLSQLLHARIHELRLKSQFVILKTAEDRLANGVPDVAVMMWFPDVKTDTPDSVEAAKQRYEAIKEAVAEASNGQATVNKFDDPSIAPQERISASIETWLEKAVVVICDLAGQRHNVYYEFGYTRAISTDVLLTCPTTDAPMTKLHLGHWQRLEYADVNELKQKLVEKLSVLLPKYDLSSGNNA